MIRLVLWLCVFALRRVLGLMIGVVVYALLGRGPAARRTMLGIKVLRRLTRL